MEAHIFQLKADQEFIQLNNLLQLLQLAQTGGHAKIIIQNEEVLVNNDIETRVRKKLYASDVVKVNDVTIKIE